MTITYQVWKNRTVDPCREYFAKSDGYVLGAIMEGQEKQTVEVVAVIALHMLGIIRRKEGENIEVGDVVQIWIRGEDPLTYAFLQNGNWLMINYDISTAVHQPRFPGDPGFMTPSGYDAWKKSAIEESRWNRVLREAEMKAAAESGHIHSDACKDPVGNTLKCGKPGLFPTDRSEISIRITAKIPVTSIPEFFGELGEVLDHWDSTHEITATYGGAPSA